METASAKPAFNPRKALAQALGTPPAVTAAYPSDDILLFHHTTQVPGWDVPRSPSVAAYIRDQIRNEGMGQSGPPGGSDMSAGPGSSTGTSASSAEPYPSLRSENGCDDVRIRAKVVGIDESGDYVLRTWKKGREAIARACGAPLPCDIPFLGSFLVDSSQVFFASSQVESRFHQTLPTTHSAVLAEGDELEVFGVRAQKSGDGVWSWAAQSVTRSGCFFSVLGVTELLSNAHSRKATWLANHGLQFPPAFGVRFLAYLQRGISIPVKAGEPRQVQRALGIITLTPDALSSLQGASWPQHGEVVALSLVDRVGGGTEDGDVGRFVARGVRRLTSSEIRTLELCSQEAPKFCRNTLRRLESRTLSQLVEEHAGYQYQIVTHLQKRLADWWQGPQPFAKADLFTHRPSRGQFSLTAPGLATPCPQYVFGPEVLIIIPTPGGLCTAVGQCTQARLGELGLAVLKPLYPAVEEEPWSGLLAREDNAQSRPIPVLFFSTVVPLDTRLQRLTQALWAIGEVEASRVRSVLDKSAEEGTRLLRDLHLA